MRIPAGADEGAFERPGRATRWSRPTFTAPLRGTAPDAAERWDALLADERSLVYRLAALLSAIPGLRRALRLPASLLDPGCVTLEDREARLAEVCRSPFYARAVRVRGLARRRRRRAPEAAPTAAAAGAPARPAVGPKLSLAVDEAIELLRTLPFELLQERGWHLQPNHFYWPLNDVAFLQANPELWHARGLPPDVEWNLDEQVALARTLHGYLDELADVPRHPAPDTVEFVWENNAFGGADAAAYYGLVRHLQPKRVVEIGAGWSSLLLARALARNDEPCHVTLIEPSPDQRLFSALPDSWDRRQTILQHADLAVFDDLRAGDVCMYDGSHCAATASDVTWFFFEVLPRLQRGVWVHVHDVCFPDDYPDAWVLDEGLSWNEQYLVHAFLAHNDAYTVRLANHALYRERREAIAELYDADGFGLWIEKTG